MHDYGAVVTEKADVFDGPTGRLALDGENTFAGGDVKSVAHDRLRLGLRLRVRFLTAGERLDDVDGGIGGNGVGELSAVENRFAVDEDRHVFAERALVIEDVAARGRVRDEIGIEHFADGRAADRSGRAGDVALDILGKSNVRHDPSNLFHFLCVPGEWSSSRVQGNKAKAAGMAGGER